MYGATVPVLNVLLREDILGHKIYGRLPPWQLVVHLALQACHSEGTFVAPDALGKGDRREFHRNTTRNAVCLRCLIRQHRFRFLYR